MDEIYREFESKPDPTVKDLGKMIAEMLASMRPKSQEPQVLVNSLDASGSQLEVKLKGTSPTESVGEKLEAVVSEKSPGDSQVKEAMLPPNPGKLATHPETSMLVALDKYQVKRAKCPTQPKLKDRQREPISKKKKKSTDKLFSGRMMMKTKSDFVRTMERLKKKKTQYCSSFQIGEHTRKSVADDPGSASRLLNH